MSMPDLVLEATEAGVVSMTARRNARRVAAVLATMTISEIRALVEEMDRVAGGQPPTVPPRIGCRTFEP